MDSASSRQGQSLNGLVGTKERPWGGSVAGSAKEFESILTDIIYFKQAEAGGGGGARYILTSSHVVGRWPEGVDGSRYIGIPTAKRISNASVFCRFRGRNPPFVPHFLS